MLIEHVNSSQLVYSNNNNNNNNNKDNNNNDAEADNDADKNNSKLIITIIAAISIAPYFAGQWSAHRALQDQQERQRNFF